MQMTHHLFFTYIGGRQQMNVSNIGFFLFGGGGGGGRGGGVGGGQLPI